LFRPLEELLPAAFLADQAAHSVGLSHASYQFTGRQWALAVDAATPVASWRPDIMARLGLSPPRTWEELMTLARRGLVAMPAIPVDTLMNLYMMWIDAGEEPFLTDEGVGSHAVGRVALETLRDLILTCAPVCLTRNPIQTYEAMTQTTISPTVPSPTDIATTRGRGTRGGCSRSGIHLPGDPALCAQRSG